MNFIINNSHELIGDYYVISRCGENNSNVFVVTITNQLLLDKWCFIEFEKSDGSKYITPQLDIVDGVVTYTLVNGLCNGTSFLKAQFIFRNASNFSWKTYIKQFLVSESLNVDDNYPIEYPDFIANAQTILDNVEVVEQEMEDRVTDCETNVAECEQTIADYTAAESTRQENEIIRQANEDNRGASETERVAAEDTRQANEVTRTTNEINRSSNEENRIDAETLRAQAETIRDDNETTRIANEDTRINNETTRGTNETNRINAETGRVNAETLRANSETTRVNNESTRQANESTRQVNETNRGNNETTRLSNETTRQTNESTRESNEQTRQANEVTRQTQEADREVAMVEFEAEVNTAIENKANIDGYYAQLGVGTANNMIPEKAAEYTETFDESGETAGGSNTVTDGVMKVLQANGNTDGNGVTNAIDILGESKAWNQLINPANYPANISESNVTITKGTGANAHKVTVVVSATPTARVTYNVGTTANTTFISGHKYLLIGCPSSGSSTTYKFGLNVLDIYDVGNGMIFTSTGYQSNVVIRIDTSCPAGTYVFEPQLIDLSLIYDSTTLALSNTDLLARFNQDFPLDYYPYDSGSVKSVNVSAINTTGFNQLINKANYRANTTLGYASFVLDKVTGNITVTVSQTMSETTAIWFENQSTIIGHKYFLRGGCANGGANKYTLVISGAQDNGNGAIYTASTNSSANGIYIFAGCPAGTYVFKPQLFDLTAMGLDNITTVSEFNVLYPNAYYDYTPISKGVITLTTPVELRSAETIKDELISYDATLGTAKVLRRTGLDNLNQVYALATPVVETINVVSTVTDKTQILAANLTNSNSDYVQGEVVLKEKLISANIHNLYASGDNQFTGTNWIDGYYNVTNGKTLIQGYNFKVCTDYIPVIGGKTYKYMDNTGNAYGIFYQYDKDKNFLSMYEGSGLTKTWRADTCYIRRAQTSDIPIRVYMILQWTDWTTKTIADWVAPNTQTLALNYVGNKVGTYYDYLDFKLMKNHKVIDKVAFTPELVLSQPNNLYDGDYIYYPKTTEVIEDIPITTPNSIIVRDHGILYFDAPTGEDSAAITFLNGYGDDIKKNSVNGYQQLAAFFVAFAAYFGVTVTMTPSGNGWTCAITE